MPHIVIAYQNQDRDFAHVLEQKLQQAGFEVWLDTNLRAGDEWRDEIDRALDAALVVCVLLTPHSAKSSYITYQWARAIGAKIPVVPLLLKPASHPHPRLSQERVFDFTHSQPPWDTLLRFLEGLIGVFKREIRIPLNTRTVEANAIRALDLPTPVERRDALENLLSVGNTDMVREVLADAVMNATFGDMRAAAAVKHTELSPAPDRRVLPGLIEALSQDDPRLRAQAARGITHILHQGPDSPAQLLAAVMPLLEEAPFWPALVTNGLCDANELVAQTADMALKTAANPAATPALIEVLRRDDSANLHNTAIDVLARIGKPALPDLVDALYTIDPVRSTPMLRAIWAIDPFYITEALHHPNPNLRHAVKQLLVTLGTEAVPVLEHALAHGEVVEGRVIVIQTLAEIGGAEAMLPLMASLSQPLSQVRAQAALALGRIGARQALPILLSLVGDDHFDVKWQTLEGLRLLKDPRAVYGVTMALQDTNRQIRLKALHLISQLNPTAVLVDLVPYLSDDDPDVRWEIATMLLANTEIAPRGVVAATTIQPSERRHWVVEQLARHGSSALPDLLEAITDSDMAIRELAADTVIDVIRADPAQNIMPELVGLIQHEDRHIRDLGLKILNSTESVSKPSLLANWNRPSDAVKAYVLQTLRDTHVETVPALVAALDQYRKPTDIWYILDLLSKLGDVSLAPLLIRYLEESNPTLRWAAARALRHIITLDAEPALTAALEDSDARVQAAAHDALMAIREQQRKKDFWTKGG